MSTPPRSLVAGLVDDAAMFPPGNAPADVALAEHVRHRRSDYADLIGPLLLPARRWPEFVSAHGAHGEPDIAVVLIGTTSEPDSVPRGVTVRGYEAAVDDVPLPRWPSGASFAAEITPGAAGTRVLVAVGDRASAGEPVVAKYRTGGTVAEAFPPPDVLADVICSAVGAAAPFKLTAGLHHAVRHTDPTTGFPHHGFLNVLVAVRVALAGGSRRQVAEPLLSSDGQALAGELARLSEAETAELRRTFVSFGCCGVEDPIDDLLALGLVAAKEPT